MLTKSSAQQTCNLRPSCQLLVPRLPPPSHPLFPSAQRARGMAPPLLKGMYCRTLRWLTPRAGDALSGTGTVPIMVLHRGALSPTRLHPGTTLPNLVEDEIDMCSTSRRSPTDRQRRVRRHGRTGARDVQLGVRRRNREVVLGAVLLAVRVGMHKCGRRGLGARYTHILLCTARTDTPC